MDQSTTGHHGKNLTAVHAWVKVVKYKLDFTSVNFYLISVSVSPSTGVVLYMFISQGMIENEL